MPPPACLPHARALASLLRLAILPLAAASVACGSTSSTTSVAPSPVRCAASATPSPASFPARGGSGTLAVSAARECAWSVASQAPWISLTPPVEGQGDGRVRYTVAANPAAAARRGVLALGAQSAEITQEPAPCHYELDRQSILVDAGAADAALAVSAPAGCAWTARATVPWITITDGREGNGPGQVRIRVSANPAVDPRSGSLDVAGLRVDVRQLGTPCTYEIEPPDGDIGPEPAEGGFSVRTEAGCAWTAVSDQPWLTITGSAAGTGPGEVRYRVPVNEGPAGRTGRISVAPAIFTLRQAPCEYGVEPLSASFEALGGRGRIDVTTSASCPWSAATRDAWIAFTSATRRTGSGRLDYTVSTNALTDVRTGVITIASIDVAVTQEGAVSLAGSVSGLEGTCPDVRFVIRGIRIRTTGGTEFEGGACRDLQNGVIVRVKGIIGRDGVLTASEVDF